MCEERGEKTGPSRCPREPPRIDMGTDTLGSCKSSGRKAETVGLCDSLISGR